MFRYAVEFVILYLTEIESKKLQIQSDGPPEQHERVHGDGGRQFAIHQ